MLRGALTILFLAMVFPLAVAKAGGAENEFLARVVGPLKHKGAFFACFVRQYDAAHLAAHPKQRVTFAKALIDAYYRASSLSPSNGGYSYQVSLAFRFRGRPEMLTQVAECGDGKPKDSLRGGAICAGPGSSPSHLALDGRDILLLTFRGGAEMWMPGPVDKRHDVVKNPFGPDDMSFRLVRTDVGACEDLAFGSQKPLRNREP